MTAIEYDAVRGLEIVRDDGWRYRLHGIRSIEQVHGDDDWYRSWSLAEAVWNPITTWRFALLDLSDKTLDSIRALRDEFPAQKIEIHTDL